MDGRVHRKGRQALLLLILAGIAGGPAAFSQTFPFAAFTTADGLAQSAVSCFYQDAKGYMWFGTWGGISCYDGQAFRSYGNSSHHVICLDEGPGHALWVGTTDGIATLVPGDSALRRAAIADSLLPSPYVMAMRKDRNGVMWVGTDKGLVIITPSGKSAVITRERGLPDNYIASIREDHAGGMLVATGRGIIRCRVSGTSLADVETLIEGPIIGAMIVLQNGDVLASAVGEKTVIRYRDGTWRTVFSSDLLGPAVNVRSLAEDEEGNLWIGTTLGLVMVENGVVHRLPRNHRLPSEYFGAIYRDRENVLWFGTEGGVFKLSSTMCRNYNYATGLQGDHVIAVFQEGRGNMWFGMYNGAARLGADGQITSFGMAEGLPHLAVHSFAQGRNGSVWVGTWEGLMLYENGRLRPGPVRELRRARVIRLLPDRDGAIWCGSYGRIIRATPAGRVTLALGRAEGIPDAGVCALYHDDGGTLWFGTDTRGGGYYRDGHVVLLGGGEGLPDPWVMSISQDRHGAIWFATQRGAVRWNGTRFEPPRTTQEDLRGGIVTFVVRDSLGGMWFGTQRGVYQWSDSVVAQLTTQDGLIADATRCGSVDSRGYLWVGTVGGVSRLDVVRFSVAGEPPPVEITGLALDEHNGLETRTAFASDENSLTVLFNALSFKEERQTEFQWMLRGIDEAWQQPRTERRVRYSHLPWGDYEFFVRARNRRTAWSDPVNVAFVIRPPFWATWWFLLLSGSAVAGAHLLMHRRRIRNLEKEKQAEQRFSQQLLTFQERERARIAGELHDSLAQNLLVAKNRSLLGVKRAEHPDLVRRELEEVSNALTEAIEDVRKIAHNLRPYQLDRLGLSQALRSLVSNVSESAQIGFSADIDPVDGLFSPEASTTVYRIVQEAMNNILKHSGASRASVAVKRRPTGVSISVQDNGCGIPADRPRGSHAIGFGLNGIEQRVKMLGGVLSVSGAAGAGTTLAITIPLEGGTP